MERKNRLYTRLFLSVVISVSVTITALTGILYEYFVKIIVNQTYTIMSNDLRLVSQNTDYLVDSVSKLSLSVYYDSSISKLLFPFEPDNAELNTSLAQLDYYRAIYPFIESIYVYNDVTGYFYISSSKVNNSIVPADQFFDREVIDDYAGYQNFTPVPRLNYTPDSRDDSKIIYSFMYFGAYESAARPEYAVVVNVASDWVDKVTNGLNQRVHNSMYIMDYDGRVISGNLKYPFLERFTQEVVLDHITTSSTREGYLIHEVDGTKSFIAYLYLESCNWIYVLEVPYETVMEDITKLKNNTIFIALLILTFGLLGSLVIFSKLYHPVKHILTRLKKLEVESKDSADTLKQHFLRELISSSDAWDREAIQRKMIDFEIKTDFFDHPVMLVLLKMDQYRLLSEKMAHEDRNQLKIAIMNRAKDFFAKTFDTESIDLRENQIMLLIKLPSRHDAIGNERDLVVRYVKEIQEDVRQHRQISISAVIGSQSSLQSGISNSYHEVMEAALHIFIYGHACVIDALEVAGYKTNLYDYSVQQEKAMAEHLVSGKIDQAKKLYLETIRELREQPYSVIMVNLTRLLYAIHTTLETMNKNSLLSIHINLMNLLYDGSETLDELNAKLFDTLDEIGAKIQGKKDTSVDFIVNKIIGLIHKDYGNPDLSVEYFANQIHMSPAHLSRLFKQASPETITSYINRVRMEKAKELLLNTDAMVEQVAQAVGFSSSTYFFKCFKKHYGTTPGEFRLKHQFEKEKLNI